MLLPWLLIDIILIPGMVRDENMKTISELTGYQSLQSAENESRSSSDMRDKPLSQADRKREAMLEDLRQTGYRKERREEKSALSLI